MPKDYGVLKGMVLRTTREDSDPTSPHFQVLVSVPRLRGGIDNWRCPVNVRSKAADANGSHDLLYYFDNDLLRQGEASLVERWRKKLSSLTNLETGFHALDGARRDLGLDFVKEDYFAREAMSSLPATGPSIDDDLQDLLSLQLRRAIDNHAVAYIFGSKFGGGREAGVHNVHMNQGNPPGPFFKDNGAFEDGGLILQFGDGPTERWVGFFLAFKTQSWNTDEQGNPRR